MRFTATCCSSQWQAMQALRPHGEGEVARLEWLGAHRTLLPFLNAAERAAELILADLCKLRQIQPSKSGP
jgi:hypothetical protein